MFAAVLLILAATVAWQHVRYLRIRRDVVQDRQPLLYGPSTFHVVTFLDAERSDVIGRVRELRDALERGPNARLIYAGQAAFTRPSSQLGLRSWDAVVLVQYPSRDAYEATRTTEAYHRALGKFSSHYSHGLRRPALPNLLIPQALLVLRSLHILRGHWTVVPLTAAPTPNANPEQAQLHARQADLLQLRPINDDALVVFNLILAGNAAQKAADRSYGTKMLARMAALAHGPVHMGKAVTLEGNARFDTVAIVFYPGVRYFAELVGSRFFQGIIGDKQLGDTQAVPTVPILSRL